MQLVRELRNERVSAKFRARTRIRASFLQENSKLNETRYFSGSFKPSLKCGIAENVDFRKYRIGARARTRTSASFQKNSQLNKTRYFSVSFNRSAKKSKCCLPEIFRTKNGRLRRLKKTSIRQRTAAIRKTESRQTTRLRSRQV